MLEMLLCKDWTAGRDEILRLVTQDVQAEKAGVILL